MAQPNGNLVPQSGLLPLSSGAKGFQLSGNGGAFPISSPAPVVGKSNLTPNGNGGFN